MRPDFGGMRGEHHPVIDVGSGISQHRLLGSADLVHRRADFFHVDQPAAGELRQIEHDHLDMIIGGGQLQRAHHVADPVLLDRCLSPDQQHERVLVRGFFDHRAIELEQQRPILERRLAGPRGERAVEPGKEQQHEQQHQPILDGDEQMPNFAGELHAGVLSSGFDRPISSVAHKRQCSFDQPPIRTCGLRPCRKAPPSLWHRL